MSANPPARFQPEQPFRPAPGLVGPHLQTFASQVLRSWWGPRLKRERWETPDDDFIDVDLLEAPPSAPHLCVFHGLEGSSRSVYVLNMLRGAKARGWGAMAFNFRSCSGEDNRQLRSYCSGETQDPAFALERLRARGVEGPLFAVGFSLGGNALLKMLAEQGDGSPVTAAAAVSAPYDLEACAGALDADTGMGAFYRGLFMFNLKRKALAKARRFPGVLDVDRIRRVAGFREFDDLVTAKVNGFRDALDYWRRCSSGPLLERIRRPSLLVSAEDDPIARLGRSLEGLSNPWVTALITRHGGHVGFVAGSVLRPVFWAEEQALRFFDAHASGVTTPRRSRSFSVSSTSSGDASERAITSAGDNLSSQIIFAVGSQGFGPTSA
jgi:predicted alpha/beta-fold hydrolase